MADHTQLPGLIRAVAPIISRYGYLAVGGLITAEDFGVPAPGETVLIAAAVFAGLGRLNIVAVGLIAFVAAVVGDNIGYAIGRYGGRRLVARYGRYVLLTPERLDTAEAFVTRHGGKVVIIARFVEGLRQANGLIAGITGMPWRRFLVFNALGAALWVALWAGVGDLAGNHLEAFRRYEIYFAVAVGAAGAAWLGWWWRRKRAGRRRPTTPVHEGSAQEDEQTRRPRQREER